MSRTRTAAILAVTALTLRAQEHKLSVYDAAWKGMEVQFVTKVEPPGAQGAGQLPGGVIVGEGRAHHIINDAAHKRYFGYEIELEPNQDGSAATVHIEPLQSRPYEFSAASSWTLLALPKYPAIPGVKLGDTVALDLLVNPMTGQKIVDYLTLRRHGIAEAAEAHDFTLSDVEMSLRYPRVSINGKLVDASAKSEAGTSGAVVWLYLEGHGRFVLTLFPNPKLGFEKNGVASSTGLWFRGGSTEYRVECAATIAPGSGAYNVYVVHQPDWRPPRIGESFTIGSADKAEWVIGKH